MKTTLFIRIFLLIFICLGTVQCDIADSIDKGVDEFRLFREQSIHEIDVASQQITAGVGSIKDVLENLGNNLPKEIRHLTSFDVPFIIDAASGETTSAALCFTDAAAGKALYLLALMKSEIITGEPVPLPDPFICHTSVGAINLNQDRNQRSILEFTGYNLFLNRRFHAAFFSPNGDSIPVPVGRPTQYRVAANLSNFDDNTIKNFKYLNLYYEDQPLSSLFIVKQNQVPPRTNLVSPRKRPTDIAAYLSHGYVNGHKIDKDCRVTVIVTFGNDRKRAYVDMTIHAYPFSFPITNKSQRNYYYTAPTGWHIKNLTGQSYTTYYSFLDVTKEEDIRQILFGQLRVKAKGSIIGSDAGAVLSFGNDVPDILIEEGD